MPPWPGESQASLRLGVELREQAFERVVLGAYFSIEQIASFAEQLAKVPLPANPRPTLVGGFWQKDRSDQLEQEHLAIEVYPVNHRGHIGVQVRLGEEVWDHNRPEQRHQVQLELLTTYEPLARFGRSLLALAKGSVALATLEGEAFP